MNTACQKLSRLMVHGLAWAICIGGNAACVYAIYHFSEHMHQVSQGRFKVQNVTFTMAKKFYRRILTVCPCYLEHTTDQLQWQLSF